MDEKLEKEIFEKYPDLFAQRKLPMSQTCMCWGLECGSGWAKLITQMAKELSTYAKKHNTIIQCTQVKEKWGTLRVYLSASNDAVDKIVAKAERASAKTCEVCGGKGKATDNGWVKTLCDKCRKKSAEPRAGH